MKKMTKTMTMTMMAEQDWIQQRRNAVSIIVDITFNFA